MRPKLYHMEIRGKISRLTLADANETRDWRIFAEFAQVLIAEAKTLYAGEDFGGYIDFERLYRIHEAGAFFVTRGKSNLQCRRQYSRAWTRPPDFGLRAGGDHQKASASPNQPLHNPTGYEHRHFRKNTYFQGTFRVRVRNRPGRFRKTVVAEIVTDGYECCKIINFVL
jgi:hypothetical protein